MKIILNIQNIHKIRSNLLSSFHEFFSRRVFAIASLFKSKRLISTNSEEFLVIQILQKMKTLGFKEKFRIIKTCLQSNNSHILIN